MLISSITYSYLPHELFGRIFKSVNVFPPTIPYLKKILTKMDVSSLPLFFFSLPLTDKFAGLVRYRTDPANSPPFIFPPPLAESDI